MKKIISFMLILVICLSLSISALATNDNNVVSERIYIEENGQKEEISYAEYQELLATTNPIGITYTFDEDTSKTYHYWAAPVYVSNIGAAGQEINVQFTHTVTATFSANLEYAAKHSIIDGLSFSAGLKLENSTGVNTGSSYLVPPNMYARITWEASMKHIEGTLYTHMLLNTGATVTVPQDVTGEVPVLIDGGPATGIADGIFDHVQSPNRNDLL